MDAGAFGSRLGLDDAYRFARGEEVVSTNGTPARLSRPLDFLVIADHSDNMGFFPDLLAVSSISSRDPKGRDWYERIKAGEGVSVAVELIGLFSHGQVPRGADLRARTPPPTRAPGPRQSTPRSASTTPVTSRRSSATSGPRLVTGNNLHRVVIYRDGASKAGQMVPFTTLPPWGSTNPRDLWNWLQSTRQGRAETSWRSPTTATSPTASCFR